MSNKTLFSFTAENAEQQNMTRFLVDPMTPHDEVVGKFLEFLSGVYGYDLKPFYAVALPEVDGLDVTDLEVVERAMDSEYVVCDDPDCPICNPQPAVINYPAFEQA